MNAHNENMEFDAAQRRAALNDFMHKTGLKPSPWEAEAKLGDGTLRKFLKVPPDGISTKTLTDKTYVALAQAATRMLKRPVSVSELQGLAHKDAYLEPPKSGVTFIDHNSRGDQTTDWPQTVLVYGAVTGGAGGLQMGENQAIDWARRPPKFEARRGKAKDIFAVQVEDSTMDPRHRLDDLLYVDPVRQPVSGDDVVIEIIDEHNERRAFLRELRDRNDIAVTLRQLTPPLEYDVPAAQVVRLLRVMTMRDLFGL